MIAVAFLLACLAAALRPTAAAEAGRGGILQIPSAAELNRARCPSSCGGVAIGYPFGIGPGCFRQGFELTCNSTANHKRLFLANTTTEVLELFPGGNGLRVRPIHFDVTMKPGMNDTYNMSWEAPVKGVMAPEGTRLFVVGCGVGVYLFGNETNNPIGTCMSICLDDKEAMKEAYTNQQYDGDVGMGYCSIPLRQDVPAFGFILGRLNGGFSALSSQGQGISDSIKVFLPGYYDFHTVDIYSSKVDDRNADGAYLGMAITDQTNCEDAQKNKSSYACSADSDCHDLSSGGYWCRCPSYADDENPYILDGCQELLLPHYPTSIPAISIPEVSSSSLPPAAAPGDGATHHGEIWRQQGDDPGPAVSNLAAGAVLRRPDELLFQSFSTSTLLPWCPRELLRHPLDAAALLPRCLDELLGKPLFESMVHALPGFAR
ncbi:Wall-associated receptor kinase 5 [Hordeum vulgare]|nr:Wall-associated receptor kinase 5 [Hordeum vulgare]